MFNFIKFWYLKAPVWYWRILPENLEILKKTNQTQLVIKCIDYNDEVIGEMYLKIEKILIK